MEIRALTGFNESIRRRYGRSYSPLNGLFGTSPYEGLTDEQWSAMTAQERINYSRNNQSKPKGIEDPSKEFYIERPDLQAKERNKYVKPLLIIGGIAGAILLYKKFK